MLASSLLRRNACNLVRPAKTSALTYHGSLRQPLSRTGSPSSILGSAHLTYASHIVTTGFRRYASTAALFENDAGKPLPRIDIPQYKPDKSGNIYPPKLNIYHAGVYGIAYLGIVRVCSLGIYAYCILVAAPSQVYDPSMSSLWVVPTILIPTTLMALLNTPFVTSVDLVLPPGARKSAAALEKHVSAPPPMLELDVTAFARVLPKPKQYVVYFDELRRLPKKFTRLTNLEYVPFKNRDLEAARGFWGNAVRRFLGRFVVSQQIKEKAVARGLWPRIWKALLVEGETREQAVIGKSFQEATGGFGKAPLPGEKPAAKRSGSVSRPETNVAAKER